ncbi:hypothetical protein HanIR_Chr10g0453071 [Helianthus annuus]|nr:hypothetical protein HanIR_Chr10g0453071 [Helianthus annuus]
MSRLCCEALSRIFFSFVKCTFVFRVTCTQCFVELNDKPVSLLVQMSDRT